MDGALPGKRHLDGRRLARLVQEVVRVEVQQVAILAQVRQHTRVVMDELGPADDAERAQGGDRLGRIMDLGHTGQSAQLSHRRLELVIATVESGRLRGRPRMRDVVPGQQQLELARAVDDQHPQTLLGPVQEQARGRRIERLLIDDQGLVAGAVRLDDPSPNAHVIVQQQARVEEVVAPARHPACRGPATSGSRGCASTSCPYASSSATRSPSHRRKTIPERLSTKWSVRRMPTSIRGRPWRRRYWNRPIALFHSG